MYTLVSLSGETPCVLFVYIYKNNEENHPHGLEGFVIS